MDPGTDSRHQCHSDPSPNRRPYSSYLGVPAPTGMGDSYDYRCPLASCLAKSFALAYKVLVWGVGIPSFPPNSTTTPTTLSNSIGRPASASWSIDVL